MTRLCLLVVIAACGGRAGDDTTIPLSQRFTPESTATDVVDALRFEVQPPAPKVVFAMPVTSRWGSPMGLAQLRAFALQPSATYFAANGVVYPAPAEALPFSKINRPLIARLDTDELRHDQWHEAVSNIGRHEATADLTMILDDAKRRWDELVVRDGAAFNAALADAGARTPGAAVGAEVESVYDVFVPSWTAGRIVVTYARRVVRLSSKSEEHKEEGCTKYIRRGNENGSCEPPIPRTVTTTRDYAADLAFIVSYDASGKFIGERAFAPHARPGRGVKTGG